MNCYLLAGGESRRMGRSKVELFGDSTLAVARSVFDEVILVQRAGAARLAHVVVIHDAAAPAVIGDDGGAAILGVVAALRHAANSCFILAIDYPLLTSDVLRFIRVRFEQSDAPLVVPEWQGRPQLLCGAYGAEMLSRVEAEVRAAQFALRRLLDTPGAEMIPEHELRARFAGEPLMNVNTPAELRAAENMHGRS